VSAAATATATATDSTITLATGLRYHVTTWSGDREDRTFLLVHGFSDLGRGWEAVAERLAPHGRVVAPDLRGHGDSEWIGAGGYYHFFDYLADLDDVVAQCVRGKLVLVGHSMGGSISGYYAGARADRVASLVLLEGLGPPDAVGVDLVQRTASWIDAWKRARAKTSFRAMASLDVAIARLRKNDRLLDEPTARRLAELGTKPVPDDSDGAGGITWKHDPLHMTMGPYLYRLSVAQDFWGRVTCPVLCVDGAESQLNLPIAERAARRAQFARCRHAIVERAGHALQRHQPAEVAQLILDHAASSDG
jgi:pimeloyl-ACP methyl ester carboxylesterase